jgi:hypothetical protein
VLRDIQASHGALRLSELHRFIDPAEAVATLAVRDGRAEALGPSTGRHSRPRNTQSSTGPAPAANTAGTSPELIADVQVPPVGGQRSAARQSAPI